VHGPAPHFRLITCGPNEGERLGGLSGPLALTRYCGSRFAWASQRTAADMAKLPELLGKHSD
jgi:hypothetical protein